ncbi:hypothetical protein [Stutzerimonas kunmingensis]|uniref:hypothetical protein n=1 Tax=Stutzerimonas kunmingensis TaxID=1211807 RepID=UPI002FC684BC
MSMRTAGGGPGKVAMEANSNNAISVEIDGVAYSSISDAAQKLGLYYSLVNYRVSSPNFPNYRRLGETTRCLVKTFEERAIAKPLIEPKPWPFDGGVRRAQVLNPNFNPPRVIRKIGWIRCMACRRYHFSQDVARVRICSPCGGNGGDKLHNG